MLSGYRVDPTILSLRTYSTPMHYSTSICLSHVHDQDLRQYLCHLAEQCNSEESETELPTVVILDNLHHIGSLSDIFNGFLNCKYHKWWVAWTLPTCFITSIHITIDDLIDMENWKMFYFVYMRLTTLYNTYGSESVDLLNRILNKYSIYFIYPFIWSFETYCVIIENCYVTFATCYLFYENYTWDVCNLVVA